MAKLTPERIFNIEQEILKGTTYGNICVMFNISRSTIKTLKDGLIAQGDLIPTKSKKDSTVQKNVVQNNNTVQTDFEYASKIANEYNNLNKIHLNKIAKKIKELLIDIVIKSTHYRTINQDESKKALKYLYSQ